MSDHDPTPPNPTTQPEAWWPTLLLGLYLITLIIGVVGEVFEVPNVLAFFLYR